MYTIYCFDDITVMQRREIMVELYSRYNGIATVVGNETHGGLTSAWHTHMLINKKRQVSSQEKVSLLYKVSAVKKVMNKQDNYKQRKHC